MNEKPYHKFWPTGVKKVVDYPIVSIHEHFKKLVERNKERTYLSILGVNYSYLRVDEESSRLASALIKKGIEKGDRVGLFMPNVPQFVIAFMGILKAGATVVPISPLYREMELKKALKRTQIKGLILLDILYPDFAEIFENSKHIELIVRTSLGDILPPVKRFLAKLIRKLPKSPKIPESVALYDLINQSEPLTNFVKVNPKEDIAVIGLTGGTTGTPKAAMLSHENIISNLFVAREWALSVQKIGEHKKFLGAVPFFHIIGMTAVMLVTAHFDSTVYLIPDPRKFESILKTIEKNRINYMHGVPTLFKALVTHSEFEKYDLSSLEVILSGAAPLSADLGKKLEDETGAIVVEAYGLTETSPIVAANPFQGDLRRFGTIGIPFPNTEIQIMDPEKHEPLPRGKIGEIAIKGPQVFKGYLERPGKTTDVLVDGYLFTGDMGYMNEDGFIYLVNRKKDMINASGYKIYPSEIEKLVKKQFKEIDEVALIGEPDEYRGETAKLIAVVKANAKLKMHQIMDYLKEKVAKYKVPEKIEIRKEPLPKTAIGKIDRKLLRKPPIKH